MIIEFSAEIGFWHGPSPFYFVTVPEEHSLDLKAILRFVTYGWGMIPVTARIGATEWKTSMFPKNGGYIVPLKDSVRKRENLGLGAIVTVRLEVH